MGIESWRLCPVLCFCYFGDLLSLIAIFFASCAWPCRFVVVLYCYWFSWFSLVSSWYFFLFFESLGNWLGKEEFNGALGMLCGTQQAM